MCSKNLLPLSLLFAGLTSQLAAQTYTNLYNFANGTDGATPMSGLVLSQNTLYGTTYSGGSGAAGTVFAVNTDGSGFNPLHEFTTGDDGGNPYSGLILSGRTLYGTASTGGANLNGNGTVFSVNTDGSGFTTVYSFAGGAGGAEPWGGVVLSSNTLYGTTYLGGSGQGIVFAVNTDGTGFQILHTFSGSDGAAPYAGPILSGSTLYGTTQKGGSAGNGTVYAVNIDGSNFTNLHSFTVAAGSPLVNNDGENPWSGLVLAGKTLYGTAYSAGGSGSGTIFAVNTDGTGFTVLHAFSSTSGLNNIDGGNPAAPLILSGNTLYGTAQLGGNWGSGTIFSMNTNGTGFSTLYNFSPISTLNSPNSDGAYPISPLILSGSTLFGTAYTGGSSGYGSVFSLSVSSPPPELIITPLGNNVILTWPTNATGFILQTTTNLGSPSIWSTVSPGPFIVNGQNTITNPMSDLQQFFRLSK